MKKLIVLVVLGVLSASAIADLAYFQFQGGALYDENGFTFPTGVYTDAAVIYLGDRTPFVSDGTWGLQDFYDPYTTVDIAVGPAFLGHPYSTVIFSERPSSIIGETITLVIDPNGGGLQIGDLIGIGGTAVIQDMADVGEPAPSGPQTINSGDIFVNIDEVPEPSTIGLMGIAGAVTLCLRRKRFR